MRISYCLFMAAQPLSLQLLLSTTLYQPCSHTWSYFLVSNQVLGILCKRYGYVLDVFLSGRRYFMQLVSIKVTLYTNDACFQLRSLIVCVDSCTRQVCNCLLSSIKQGNRTVTTPCHVTWFADDNDICQFLARM